VRYDPSGRSWTKGGGECGGVLKTDEVGQGAGVQKLSFCSEVSDG